MIGKKPAGPDEFITEMVSAWVDFGIDKIAQIRQ